MKSTVTTRGQTVIPAIIRKQYNILPRSRIEWLDDGYSITVFPVAKDAVTLLRGKYKLYPLNETLVKSRGEERSHS